MPGQATVIAELEEAIGVDALVQLAEAFGGTRLYVPTLVARSHDIAKAVGIEAATKLSERFAPDVIIVPLMRDRRARLLKAAGRSHAQIARALGMTEKGIDKMFRRDRVGED